MNSQVYLWLFWNKYVFIFLLLLALQPFSLQTGDIKVAALDVDPLLYQRFSKILVLLFYFKSFLPSFQGRDGLGDLLDLVVSELSHLILNKIKVGIFRRRDVVYDIHEWDRLRQRIKWVKSVQVFLSHQRPSGSVETDRIQSQL